MARKLVYFCLVSDVGPKFWTEQSVRNSVIVRVCFSQTFVTFAGDLAAVRISGVSERLKLTVIVF